MKREPEPAARPTLRVDLAVIARNWRAARQAFSGQQLGAVLKYDAYGLGMAQVAPPLVAAGCTNFWLATVEEAVALRPFIQPPARLFVLNGLGGHDPGALLSHSLIPVLTHLDEVHAARAYAQRSGALFPVAIHLDTGLTRVGLQEADVQRLAQHSNELCGLQVVAWVTQLARFDDLACESSLEQRMRFDRWTATLPAAERSLATSTGVFGEPGWHFDHGRMGSALFGIQAGRAPYAVEAAASLSAPVLRVAEVPAGVEVGYGGTYRTPKPARLATLAVGYGDGLPAGCFPQARVYFNGVPAPVVGSISMSLMTVDVSALGVDAVRPGDCAEMYGPSQSVEQLARSFGVTPNAVLVPTARLAHRVWSQT